MNKKRLTKKIIKIAKKMYKIPVLKQEVFDEKAFAKLQEYRQKVLLLAQQGANLSDLSNYDSEHYGRWGTPFEVIVLKGYNYFYSDKDYKEIDNNVFNYIKELVKCGLPIASYSYREGLENVIRYAIIEENSEFVKFIVSHGFDLNKMFVGFLGFCIQNRKLDMLKCLVENGADVNRCCGGFPNYMLCGYYADSSPLAVAELHALAKGKTSDEFIEYLKSKGAVVKFEEEPDGLITEFGYTADKLKNLLKEKELRGQKVSEEDIKEYYRVTKIYLTYLMEHVDVNSDEYEYPYIYGTAPKVQTSGLKLLFEIGDKELIECALKHGGYSQYFYEGMDKEDKEESLPNLKQQEKSTQTSEKEKD